MADWIPRSIPRLLRRLDDVQVLATDYNGLTFESFLRNRHSTGTIDPAVVCDILFQASFIASALAITMNISNRDLHARNLLVARLPFPSRRRVCLLSPRAEAAYIEYESDILVTVIDWALADPHLPYETSSSSSASQTDRAARHSARASARDFSPLFPRCFNSLIRSPFF